MNKSLRTIFTKDYFATVTNYLFRYGLRFVLIIAVPYFLSETIKGYWFTFGSVAALSTFADLGFTTIITQFAAHECTYLSFDEKKHYFKNSNKEIDGIASLFKFSTRWGLIATLIASIIIFTAGIILFGSKQDQVSWFFPWIIYASVTGCNFLISLLLAFFEGCNCIAICQRIKMVDSICTNVFSVLFLWLGFGLFALSIPFFITLICSIILVLKTFGKAIKQLLTIKTDNVRKWIKPVVGLLWRYAFSWGAGYVIFQVYTPLSFAVYGAEVSGKVGYTMTIMSAIVSISSIWSYISVPKINTLVERKEWRALDCEYHKVLLLVELTFILGIIALLIMNRISFFYNLVLKNILGIFPLLIFACGYAGQLYTSCTGIYLRAHKEEPLMMVSIVTAGLSISLTTVFIYSFGYEFVFAGFTIAVLLMIPWVYMIVKNRRRVLHVSNNL